MADGSFSFLVINATMHQITYRDILSARALLGRAVVQTPILQLPAISNLLSDRLRQKRRVEAYFKCENLQISGSFKYRGALHSLLKLSSPQLQKGVITHSTGNHALALSMAAFILEKEKRLKIPVTVVIPQHVNPGKLVKLKSTSATIVTAKHSDTANIIKETVCISQSTGTSYIPPADHSDIVLGQATCIAEFLDQLQEMGVPQPNAIILPSGGGGLLAGAALCCDGRDINVFGAEPNQGGAQLGESLRRGIRLEYQPHMPTVADGLRTSIGRLNWQLLRNEGYISGVLAAHEKQIVGIHQLLLASTDMPVEPSAAVGVAAAVSGENMEFISSVCTGPALRLGFVLTGGNAHV